MIARTTAGVCLAPSNPKPNRVGDQLNDSKNRSEMYPIERPLAFLFPSSSSGYLARLYLERGVPSPAQGFSGCVLVQLLKHHT